MTSAPTSSHPAGRPGPAPTGPAGSRPSARRSAARPPSGPSSAAPPADRLLRLATAVAQLLVEVERGLRPQRQLERCASEGLRARLAAVQGRPRHADAPLPVLHRVQGVRTAPHRYDAVALVQREARLTCVGLGFVLEGGRWLLDELARPEGPPLPPPAYPVPCDQIDAFELTLRTG